MKHTLLITTALIITALMLIVGCSKDGIETKYYENGQKSAEGTYKDGNPDGIWSYWSPDGKESSVLIHSDGKSWDGIYTSWFESGQKWTEEIYNNGKQERGTFWWENGQKRYETTYKDGVEIEFTEWNEDGNKR